MKPRLSALCTVLFALFLAPAAARAQLACGTVIGPDASVVLSADVGPCALDDADFALKVVGPAKLDLAGHRVLCDAGDRPDGIVVEGTKAQLRGGAVIQCARGIALLDSTNSSGHRIENMTVRESAGIGIESNATAPSLLGNTVTGGGADGIYARGGTLTNNTSIDNEGDGFDLQGSGAAARLRGNVASGNARGFVLAGEPYAFDGNLAVSNSGDGLVASGNLAKVGRNRLLANGGSGIQVPASGDGHTISRNVALGNAIEAKGRADLVDEDCAKLAPNDWSRNVFSTSLGACVE